MTAIQGKLQSGKGKTGKVLSGWFSGEGTKIESMLLEGFLR
jgi:hypothetical protein